jgi:hypothetical protein
MGASGSDVGRLPGSVTVCRSKYSPILTSLSLRISWISTMGSSSFVPEAYLFFEAGHRSVTTQLCKYSQ